MTRTSTSERFTVPTAYGTISCRIVGSATQTDPGWYVAWDLGQSDDDKHVLTVNGKEYVSLWGALYSDQQAEAWRRDGYYPRSYGAGYAWHLSTGYGTNLTASAASKLRDEIPRAITAWIAETPHFSSLAGDMVLAAWDDLLNEAVRVADRAREQVVAINQQISNVRKGRPTTPAAGLIYSSQPFGYFETSRR